jgi:hypothetical protein
MGPAGPAAPEGGLQVGPLPAAAAVELAEHPSAEWLELWWSVDGRGGAAALETAQAILTGCPSLYALVRDDGGRPAAVGRLALAGGYGGLYCMATRPVPGAAVMPPASCAPCWRPARHGNWTATGSW